MSKVDCKIHEATEDLDRIDEDFKLNYNHILKKEKFIFNKYIKGK